MNIHLLMCRLASHVAASCPATGVLSLPQVSSLFAFLLNCACMRVRISVVLECCKYDGSKNPFLCNVIECEVETYKMSRGARSGFEEKTNPLESQCSGAGAAIFGAIP